MNQPSTILSPPTTPFESDLMDVICAESLLAVLTIKDPADAIPLARALVNGGVRVMELAWRTPATMDALKAIRQDVPEMIAGIGTLLTIEQLQMVKDAGAAFGVSPGLSVKLLKAATELGFPYAPGVMSPSEVQVAVEHGCSLLKFFPAESAGGLAQLKSMNTPFAHLGLRYIALGGLNENNAADYLKEPCVSVLGGSWIAAPDLIARKDWETVYHRAKRARELIEQERPAAATPAPQL